MDTRSTHPTVGIDDISIYLPSLVFSIEELANARNIEPAKLQKGLGLLEMAVPDTSEDVITMAAEAVIDVVRKNGLQPSDIGRIYVGTESMVDGSKPIASYVLGVLTRYFELNQVDPTPLKNCDTVDMTFACIGAVDAMLNSLDWIRLNPDRKAIVVATDWAKYDLDSPGEYTQGAGAFAVLLSANPGLVRIGKEVGVGMQCEHDFYKPLRLRVDFNDDVSSNGLDEKHLGRSTYAEHKDTPVYDGQFSNQCYTDRIVEAFHHYMSGSGSEKLLDSWSRMIFHLPYAYHARRVFPVVFLDHLAGSDTLETLANELDLDVAEFANPGKETLRAVAKSDRYRRFVNDKIADGEKASSRVGNMYTGAVFLSLLSTLVYAQDDLSDQQVGFFAYGSGSKSKVFAGTVTPGYKSKVERIELPKRLDGRKGISLQQYEYLHRNKLLVNLDSRDRIVFQSTSGWTETNKYARNYEVRMQG